MSLGTAAHNFSASFTFLELNYTQTATLSCFSVLKLVNWRCVVIKRSPNSATLSVWVETTDNDAGQSVSTGVKLISLARQKLNCKLSTKTYIK